MKRNALCLSTLWLCLTAISTVAAQFDPVDSLKTEPGRYTQLTITGAYSTLKKDKFNRGNLVDPLQLAQGKIAGFTLARPGSNPNEPFQSRLRGLSSFLSATEPLIVVNGIPGSDLSLLDPNEIASMTFLKDASSAAQYGIRGAAGVIMIETGKGEPGRIGVEYSAQVAIDRVSERYSVFDAANFVQNGGTDLSPQANVETDWQDLVMRTALSHSHHLGISGGLKQGHFRIGLNYRNIQGILKGNGLNQYSAQAGLIQYAWRKRLKISADLLATRRNADFGFPDAFRYAVVANPTSPVKSDEPQYQPFDGFVEPLLFDYFNPVAIIEQNAGRGRFDRLLGNLRAEAEIFSRLIASVQVAGIRDEGLAGEYYSPQSKYRGAGTNGSVRRIQNMLTNRYLESSLRRQFRLGDGFLLDACAGYAWQQFRYEYADTTAGGGFGLTRDSRPADFEPLILDPSSLFDNFIEGKNTLAAFFGRVQMNLKDKYFLEAGLRREGSSRLGYQTRWGNFLSFGAGADFSKILKINKLDLLKARIGYGIAGQIPASDGLSRTILSSSVLFFYNGGYEPGASPVLNENPDLKWEEKREVNFGLDFAWQGSKLSGSLDFYQSKVTDIIVRSVAPVPPNLANITYQNAGELKVKGFEATLSLADILDGDNFHWSTDVVLHTNKVTIAETAQTGPYYTAYFGAPGLCCGGYILVQNGAALGQFWGAVREGVNSDGTIKYKDIDRNGAIEPEDFNRDQTAIGNGMPDLQLGLNNTFKWRRFDLNIFFRGIFGHDLAHEYRLYYETLNPSTFTWNRVVTRYFDDRVTDVNRFDDTKVEKASFFRLDNATLGYNLPGRHWLRSARIYLGGQNLFTLSKYSGLDPELRLGDTGPTDNGSRFTGPLNVLAPGVDRRSTYFPARTFFFGIRLGI